jgi:hypothetical protein
MMPTNSSLDWTDFTVGTHFPHLAIVVYRHLGERKESNDEENCPRKYEWRRNTQRKRA